MKKLISRRTRSEQKRNSIAPSFYYSEPLEARTLLSTVGFREVTVAAGIAVSEVLAGDFNNDGKPDLLCVSDAAGEISWLAGLANGSFASPVVSTIAGSGFQTADVNGDGKLDLIGWLPNAIVIYLGNGNGTFEPAQMCPDPINEPVQAVADFNGDGRMDLALFGDRTIQLLFQQANGSFAAGDASFLGGVGSNIVVGDFDGDGVDDIAMAGGQGVVFLHCDVDGTLSESSEHWPQVSPNNTGIVAVDIDGDHATDLVVYNSLDTPTWLHDSGHGVFVPAGQLFLPAEQWFPANLTNDGVDDLLGIGTGGQGLAIVGSNVGPVPATVEGSLPAYAAAVADFNGDGLTDVAALNLGIAQDPTQVSVYFSDRVVQLTPVTALYGQPASTVLATFADNAVFSGSDPAVSAVVNWGDGTTSTADVLDAGGGLFNVIGTHTYVTPGVHKYSVNLTDSGGQSDLVSSTLSVPGIPVAPPPVASLVQDTNTSLVGSMPDQFVNLPDGRVVFAARDVEHGRELWVSDGTAQGTQLFADVNPGFLSSNPTDLTCINGTVYFGATGPTGPGFWKSDGTPAGTVELESLEGSWPVGAITALGNDILFSGDPPSSGLSLRAWPKITCTSFSSHFRGLIV